MKLITTLGALVIASGLSSAKEITTKIKIKGMTCGSCAVAVKKALMDTKEVKKADVSLEQKRATVIYEDSQVTEERLREAIHKSGLEAEPSK